MTARAPLRAVTAEEIDAFERDGFVRLPGVLSPDCLTALHDACEHILVTPEALDITEETMRLALPATPTALFGAKPYSAALAERGHFLMSFNTAQREPAVLDFALRGPIGAIAAALMRSATARFVDDILFVKDPDTHEPTEWHDDDGGSVTTGEQRCSLWVSLADVPAEGGALRFLRGSHRRFAGWRERNIKAEALVATHADDVVECPVRVGDVVAHHLATVHAAGPNHGTMRRRAWALRFGGEEARFILRPARREPREWYGLQDGDRIAGPRFPIAWPPTDHSAGENSSRECP